MPRGNRPNVTVVGSGVVGMTCAYELSKFANVTVVARDMPGDPPSKSWASPWAGAIWFGVDGSTDHQKKMQRDAFDKFWHLSESRPESSVKRLNIYDYQDMYKNADEAGLWYTFLPNFRHLKKEEVRGPGSGLFYTSVVISPPTYLPWLQERCIEAGIKFKRAEVASLAEAASIAPCDIMINASGNGARFLTDVADSKCVQVRGQVMLIKCSAKDAHIRHAVDWKNYTYVLPRGDGTAIIGGIKEFGSIDPEPKEWLRRSIHERCHQLLPEHIPAKFEDLEIIRDQVGIRPERDGNVRVEKEQIGNLNVVHAYGLTGGGYVYSWGMAAEVARLAEEYVAETPVQARL